MLHFVSRQPGLTIAELLDILKITKQSLNRVLKELVEKDFIVSRMGTTDRRQRLLFATQTGEDLALRLADLQTGRIMRALETVPTEERTAMRRCVKDYLTAMVDPQERARVGTTRGHNPKTAWTGEGALDAREPQGTAPTTHLISWSSMMTAVCATF